MTDATARVEISVDGDDLLVLGDAVVADRRCRLFFRSVIGAVAIDHGWRCPRRHLSLSSHVIRVNAFLERQGYRVERAGIAEREVEQELDRRRSFQRTTEAAIQWKAGQTLFDLAVVKQQLAEYGWSDQRTLRPHQEQGLSHALTAANAADFSVPGAGKTVTALAVAATHLAAKTIDVVLVVGPLACFGPWEKETAAALLAGRLATSRIRGSAPIRRRHYTGTRRGTLLLVSFATAAADRLALIELCRTHDTMLIVDESHRIKRFKGGFWAPALVDVARHARVRMVLSGTPMPQNGRDLYTQLNVLWPGGELTGSRDSFATRVDANFGSLLRDIQPFMTRTPKAALGLQPYEIERHQVPLQETQSEIYELIMTGLRRRLDDADTWADKIDTLRRARPIRLLQAACNPDLFNRTDTYYRLPRLNAPNPTLMERLAAYATHETPAKSLAALQLIESLTAHGSKVVCWSNFVANLDQFSALVRSRLGVPCFQIDGRVPAGDDSTDDQTAAPQRANPQDVDTRERIIERFLATDGPAVLVTNPASCSESISLHRGCHNAIYLDRTYDCAQFLQSIDRVHRLGLPSDVTVRIHIVQATHDGGPTIDHLVDASLLAKESVMSELLGGAELQPLGQSEDAAVDANGSEQDLGALLRYLLGKQSAE